MKRQPNILFCTHTTATYMPPAELSTRQIVAGPGWPDKKSGMGRIMSIKTERRFDVASLIDRLPADQKPELVVVLRDAFGGVVPTNLQNVTCRKLLYIADSHHGAMPLCKLFDYISTEKFDRYAIAHDPHHFHWFRQVGVQPLSIQLNLSARDFSKPIFSSQRQKSLYFVGQVAKLHAWRKKLIDRIAAEDIPLKTEAIPAQQASANYAKHQLCLNTSNGDWTMRFFEVLSAGGCLLTDRISEATGYAEYFKEGEDLIFYDNEEDLIEKAKYYLDKPDVCLNIARSGHAKYKQFFSENMRKQKFLDFAFSTDETAAAIANQHQCIDPRCATQRPDDMALLEQRVLAYEQMQELQREGVAKHVLLSALTPEVFASDLSDLMRLKVSRNLQSPGDTCLLLQAEEVEALMQTDDAQLPKFLFILPGTAPSATTIQSLTTRGYRTPETLLMAHPGCFVREGAA